MSVYIKISTLEYPRYEGDIRLEHPEIADVFVCPETYAPVEEVVAPEFDYVTQTAYQLPPVNTNNIWCMAWAVRDLTAQELEDRRVWEEAEKIKHGSVRTNINVAGSTPDVIG